VIKLATKLRLWWQLRREIGLRKVVEKARTRIGARLGREEPAQWSIRPRVARHPLTARLRRSSDMDVFEQIFIQDEYHCLRDLPEVARIVDLGANVGYSSVYFLNCFPAARIVAVEPDPQNYALCVANLQPYGARVTVLQGAVWSRCTTMAGSRSPMSAGNDWRVRMVEAADRTDAAEIPAWDVETLLAKADMSEVDLLKIDVEGAEVQVFGGNCHWLDRVKNLCIELHGPECERVFFQALKDYEFTLGHSGELTICRNLRRKVQA